ncbi:DUF1963 domain-containing protein [Aquimarina algiphila]|uniref:DUF1963 domain-containing protein n=1 Tax=Aquimarina algiphila TaxID=2047982 RepID=UPI00232CD164|nr:DUF1963 domain-containing protein [Aquimarina algiphila]
MSDLKQLIIDEIKEYEWDKEDGVIQSIIPNIIFSVDEQESEHHLKNSRFGGQPAVPSNFVWPIQSLGQKAPMAFFFQLNFEEIKPFDIENKFPDKGILLCFASVTDDIMWEYDVEDAFKTYYFPDSENLIFADIPEVIPPDQRLAPRTIHFKSSFQLPRYPFNYDLLEDDLISEDDADGIDQVANNMMDDAIKIQMHTKMAAQVGLKPPTPKNDLHTLFSHNLLLGVPFSVQHTISEEWAEQHFGNDDKSDQYINLISFEMKGHEGYGFSANGAHLYLCIDKDDLKNNDFSKIVALVQNT